jgi:hypothetical protein
MSPVDTRLVTRIRQRLDAGALPRERPENIWHSYGVGDTCGACGDLLLRGQSVIEVDTARKTFRLHPSCCGLWEGELIRRALFKPQ